jgi:phage tail-like protein
VPNSGARTDPYLAFRFLVSFDDVSKGGFSSCSGLQMETEVQDFVEGGVNSHSWKFATRSKQTNLTLKRGIVNKVLWDWYYDITIGKMKFQNVTIAVLDSAGAEPVIEFQLLRAFPVKWIGPELDAAQNNLAVETLELAHQGLSRRK